MLTAQHLRVHPVQHSMTRWSVYRHILGRGVLAFRSCSDRHRTARNEGVSLRLQNYLETILAMERTGSRKGLQLRDAFEIITRRIAARLDQEDRVSA
jgi:hypothetical protein